MTTTERIAAALALADICDQLEGSTALKDRKEYEARLQAYRAAAPKLRTRAEVDAELAMLVRVYAGIRYDDRSQMHWDAIERLCSEPTAPEAVDMAGAVASWEPDAAEPSCSVCDGKGYTDSCACKYVHSCRFCPAGDRWRRGRVGEPMLNPNRAKERNE